MIMAKHVPLGVRNANPLNIRFNPKNHWKGQCGQNRGFCVFRDFDYGFRAAVLLLKRYIRHGYTTTSQIISRWAPATENNVENYITYVENYIRRSCRQPGFVHVPDPRFGNIDCTADLPFYFLVCAMAQYECGEIAMPMALPTGEYRLALNRAMNELDYPIF